jgi:hypothetical protein
MVLDKQAERLAHLGLALADATPLLTPLPQHLLAPQVATFLATRSRGDTCGTPLHAKGQHPRAFRTRVGTVTLPGLRIYHGLYQRHAPTTCRPLTTLLTEPTAPDECTWRPQGPPSSPMASSCKPVQTCSRWRRHGMAKPCSIIRSRSPRAGKPRGVRSPWAFVEPCPADGPTLPSPDDPPHGRH